MEHRREHRTCFHIVAQLEYGAVEVHNLIAEQCISAPEHHKQVLKQQKGV